MTSEDPKLTLITSPIEAEPRNYWNTSGRNREFFPTEPNPDSIPILNKHGKVIQEPKSEWWINSKDQHFCFWSFVRDRSQPDGTMEPLMQSDIAKLFGCSTATIHFWLKEAMDLLTEARNMRELMSLDDLTDPDPMDESAFMSYQSDVEGLSVEDED